MSIYRRIGRYSISVDDMPEQQMPLGVGFGTVAYDVGIAGINRQNAYGPFFGQGRFWTFWQDKNYESAWAASSTDGYTWTSPDSICALDGGQLDFSEFVATYNNGDIHYAVHRGTNVYYRKGKPTSDGTISWYNSEQIAKDSGAARVDAIQVDSSGYVYIAYSNPAANYANPYITKGSINAGSWSTESGYPRTLGTGIYWLNDVTLQAMDNNKMYAIWGDNGTKSVGNYYDGATWAQHTFPNELDSYGTGRHFTDLYADGDTLHYICHNHNQSPDELYYTTWINGTWSTHTTICTPDYTEGVAVRVFNNNIYVFWKEDLGVTAASTMRMNYRMTPIGSSTFGETVALYENWGRGVTWWRMYENVNGGGVAVCHINETSPGGTFFVEQFVFYP